MDHEPPQPNHSNMKISCFIEADAVVRHFIHSGAFRELVQAHEVTFVFPEPGYKRMGTVEVDKLDLHGAAHRHLRVHQIRQQLWKPLFQVDRLRHRGGSQASAVRRFIRYAIGPKAAALYTVLALPGIYQAFRMISLRRLCRHPYSDLQQLLDELKPDLVIHPSVMEGVYINDLVEALPKRNVPLVVVMNSWDNPSTKRAMIGHPDWLLVWGEQTAQHAVTYAGMPADRVVRFGAAQFDVYRDPPRMDRAAICASHDIDPASRILLYAGSSKGTDEFSHLVQLDELIADHRLPNTTVIYRPHPWGNGGHGGERIVAHSWNNVRIEASMRGYLEDVAKGQLTKSLPDYRDTRDLLFAIDAMVSPLSTIILEAAALGKPAMCLIPNEELQATHLRYTMPQVHFEALYAAPEIPVAHSLSEMVAQLPGLMECAGDETSAARLSRLSDFFIEPFDRSFGCRLVDFVEGVVAPRKTLAA